jgi:hypothetical protein
MSIDFRQFLKDAAIASGDDYSMAFKLLGMVAFVAEAGPEPLLTGRLVSIPTLNRWMETLRLAGWGDVIADLRLRQAVREYVKERVRGGIIEQTRENVADAVARVVAEEAEPSPQAAGRQASDAVKGLAGGREAEPSALDGVAPGGSLGEATAHAVRDGEGC